MPQLEELLVEQLKDLLHAETQLTDALPKMAEAAQNHKLKEAFEKHLVQTQGQIERLRSCFEMLGEEAEPKTCKGMMGLIAEGEETIQEAGGKESVAADLALIAAAQRVEHYEISAYGTARSLARQIGQNDCARLLSHTLGEEETSDFLLTAIADPLMQQATLEDNGAEVDLETVPSGAEEKQSGGRQKKTTAKTRRGAA
jgi:Mn-containing catalase